MREEISGILWPNRGSTIDAKFCGSGPAECPKMRLSPAAQLLTPSLVQKCGSISAVPNFGFEGFDSFFDQQFSINNKLHGFRPPLNIAATEGRSRKIRMSELKQRIVGMSLDRRALLEQRLLRARRLNRTQPTIPPRQSTDAAWLSFGQQHMWFLDQLTPGTSTYNIPDAMQVSGPLHVEALEQALHAIVGRHEILRTHLASVDGNPVPLVDEHWKIKVSMFDVRSLPGPERAAEA